MAFMNSIIWSMATTLRRRRRVLAVIVRSGGRPIDDLTCVGPNLCFGRTGKLLTLVIIIHLATIIILFYIFERSYTVF